MAKSLESAGGRGARDLGCSDTYLTGVEVEVGGVEVVALGKVGHAHAKVADLVHGGWPLLQALELVDASVLLVGLEGCNL